MGQFKPMTGPYGVYLAPAGQAWWLPSDIDDLPPSPWVEMDDGDIDQNPVIVTLDIEKEKFPLTQNSTFRKGSNVIEQGVMIQFSMQNPGLETVAKLYEDTTLNKVTRSPTQHEAEWIEFKVLEPKYWSILLLSKVVKEIGSPKTPGIIQLAMAEKADSVEYTSSSRGVAMTDVKYEALQYSDGRVGRWYNITRAKGT